MREQLARWKASLTGQRVDVEKGRRKNDTRKTRYGDEEGDEEDAPEERRMNELMRNKERGLGRKEMRMGSGKEKG